MATHQVTGRDGAELARPTRPMSFGRRLATETKAAFKTAEFWSFLALVAAILISAAAIKGGDDGTDQFIARHAWLYVSILGAGCFISRGLAKSASRETVRRRQRRERRPLDGRVRLHQC